MKNATKYPYNPTTDDNTITKIRKIETIPCKDRLTKVYVATEEDAITTINIGLANPARIAASPIMIRPTTLSVEPIAIGIRKPASLKNSNKNTINNVSRGAGKGTLLRDSMTVPRKATGNWF